MSEFTVMKKTALTLQRVPGMKSIVVGLLAVFVLTGCGVGIDDVDGQQASSGVAVNGLIAAGGDNTVPGQAEIRGPVAVDPRVALPQDPIPVFESKPVGPRPTK